MHYRRQAVSLQAVSHQAVKKFAWLFVLSSLLLVAQFTRSSAQLAAPTALSRSNAKGALAACEYVSAAAFRRDSSPASFSACCEYSEKSIGQRTCLNGAGCASGGATRMPHSDFRFTVFVPRVASGPTATSARKS